MSDTAITQGAHHIGLSVPDIKATAAFFCDTLGYAVVGEKPAYPAIFVSDGVTMLTLWQVADPANAAPFDRKTTIGLHHVALKLADGGALDALHTKLTSTAGVEIEFAPEDLGPGVMRHMMCSVPGGIRIEFIAPA